MINLKITLDIQKQIDDELGKKKKQIMENLVQSLKEATPVDTGEARDGWKMEGSTIVNDVDHIKDLNQGTSKQAPAYFVESTLLSHPGVKPRGTITRSK